MRYFIFLLLVTANFSCKQTQKQKEEDLKKRVEPIVKKYFNAQGLGHIDTLEIYKIDTLTPSGVFIIQAMEYFYTMQNINDELQKKVKDLKFYSKLNQISYSQYASNEIKDIGEEGRKLIAKSDYYDSLRKDCINKVDTANKKTFIAYSVRFNLKYSDTTTLVQNSLDSGEVIVTKDFKIKEKKSFIGE